MVGVRLSTIVCFLEYINAEGKKRKKKMVGVELKNGFLFFAKGKTS
jgi:hypothetical protein